jgi:threonine/homoserine/homoserine lactone efflux protein
MGVGRPKWRNVTAWYITARLLAIPASLTLHRDWWMLCVLLFTLAWIVLAVVLALKGLRRSWLRHRSEPASAQ